MKLHATGVSFVREVVMVPAYQRTAGPLLTGMTPHPFAAWVQLKVTPRNPVRRGPRPVPRRSRSGRLANRVR